MRREVKIGIFAVLMIAALWAGGRFLRGFDLLSRNAVYYTAYENLDGVQHASHVMIRGMKIGKVTDIVLEPQHNRVVVQLTMPKRYRIPVDSETRTISYSIMGGKAVSIEFGTSAEYHKMGDTLRSVEGLDLMAAVTSELDFFKQKLTKITDDMGRTMDNVNEILETNAGSLAGSLSNLNAITRQVNTMLATNAPQVDSLMMHLSDVSGQLARADLEGMLADIDTIISRIEAGDGTLGALVNDKELYNSLVEASDNLSALLVDVEAYPKRYLSLGSGKKANKQREKDREAAAAQE